ncbi:prepilin-type N-terminal cleavage/methylation domain-containing protein [Candidatus Pelagibacter sp. Uisw_104]|jgi:type II secretory pathway pseudopilin PulG|uniref:pilus assembly FimT family protein n=1 Tax=unclassified Candidatus Pelagibacter TaxID=2647897 RepID=UPI0039E87C1E
MLKSKRIKGISLIESLVCVVIIGIGFIAVLQLSAFSIGSMDRAMEKNKLNYLSEMVMEDMIGDPDNISNYGSFNETCSYSNKGGSNLYDKQKDKWRNKLQEKDYIKISNKYKRPPCYAGDSKKTFVGNNNTSGRVNFLTGKGKRKKYLGVVVK